MSIQLVKSSNSICQLSQHPVVPCNKCALAGATLHVLGSKVVVFLEVKNETDIVVETFGGQRIHGSRAMEVNLPQLQDIWFGGPLVWVIGDMSMVVDLGR